MSAVIWHDVECGAYAADLELWEGLAEETEGRILDLGCGTGRVSLHLARRGHEVVGLDADTSLLAAFSERGHGLAAEAELGDARDFELKREFGLVLAPMQLVQLFADESERVACLDCIASHLRPGGRAALAIVEEVLGGKSVDLRNVVPDAREIGDWIYSSLPLDLMVDSSEIVMRRLRQTVSPIGELGEEIEETRLAALAAGELEREAVKAGLKPAGRREIPATDDHVDSTVVLLEAP